MKSGYSVLGILNSICENKSSRSEVNYLIELAHSYAYSYLKYRYKNLSRVLLAEDVTLQELAIDAIAPLFEMDESGSFIKLTKSFNDWVPKIESEEAAAFFINRLVSRSVEKYVSELLRQSDPFFSKILDSVNYLLSKHNFKKRIILGTTFIIEDEGMSRINSLPDNQFILDLPVELFVDNAKLLPGLFDHLKDNNKSAAIPLNALVMKIKQINSNEFILTENSPHSNEIEIESIINKALNTTLNKMNISYLSKNKIDDYEAKGIKKALERVLFDMRDGGLNPGLHKYFLEQFAELTFDDYKNKYQNIFEYLFKVLKKEIVEQLSN